VVLDNPPQPATWPSEYLQAIRERVPASRVALDNLWYGKASADAFLGALATTNLVVAYIDHGLIFDGYTNASGLCFGETPPTCLLLKQLLPFILPDGTVAIDVGGGRNGKILDDGFAPKAKIVFLAACGLDTNFTDQWHLQPRQALIVPQYMVPSEKQNIDTYKSALEWEEILVALAGGYGPEAANVNAAVDIGNKAAAQNHAAHRWQVIGDGNVTIR